MSNYFHVTTYKTSISHIQLSFMSYLRTFNRISYLLTTIIKSHVHSFFLSKDIQEHSRISYSSYLVTYINPMSNCPFCQKILYIANHSRWKSFAVFTDGSITVKLFQWNILCNRFWPCKTTIQLQKFSSELHCNHETFPPWTIYDIQCLLENSGYHARSYLGTDIQMYHKICINLPFVLRQWRDHTQYVYS